MAAQFKFDLNGTGNGAAFQFDVYEGELSLFVTPIPEPATLSLVMLRLITMTACGRGRRRA